MQFEWVPWCVGGGGGVVVGVVGGRGGLGVRVTGRACLLGHFKTQEKGLIDFSVQSCLDSRLKRGEWSSICLAGSVGESGGTTGGRG